jgi:hypothetical protein
MSLLFVNWICLWYGESLTCRNSHHAQEVLLKSLCPYLFRLIILIIPSPFQESQIPNPPFELMRRLVV